eukprot:197419-Amphidinium_carterae.1
MLRAARSVLVTLLMLICLLFLFACVFRVQAADISGADDVIPSVLDTMMVLLIRGTLLDNPSTIVDQLGELSVVLVILYFIFVFLSSFTVLNMLIGILCEVISQVSETEQEEAAVQYLKGTLLELLEVYDKNDDRMIGEDEFDLLMHNPEAHLILTNFGVDAFDLVSMRNLLFADRLDASLDNKEAGSPVGGDRADYSVTVGYAHLDIDDKGGVRSLRPDAYCVVDVVGRTRRCFRTPVVRKQ